MINEAATIENAKYYAEQAGIQKGIQVGMEAIAKKMIAKGNRTKHYIGYNFSGKTCFYAESLFFMKK
ncbi:hypothetical protein GY31_13610 [Lysinibacillus sphaericus]|uniref:Uncharacterized protein n=1 Tax=Lysinibacillus sphaericus TaxID=1421 RepID=A0A2S5CZY2_LYSSH|nr:hypothetical protein [Lysinibacillus sphaericus]OEC01323.1 hypothetical protein GY31_13610 [Lysinibacillus sphaericus]POZ56361.1 hypothetical protein LYSIN_01144 [Lysinibacillus sphaericus]